MAARLAFVERRGWLHRETLSVRANRCLFRVETGDRQMVAVKFFAARQGCMPYPVRAHVAVLPNLVGSTSRLVVPTVREHGFVQGAGYFVVMDWIAGRDYRDRWHARRSGLVGGCALDDSSLHVCLELLRDLQQLSANKALGAGAAVWGQAEVEQAVGQCCRVARSVNDWTSRDCKKLQRGLEPLLVASSRPWAVSNTDFRHLNLVDISEERTALVDWDGARASQHEVEHCVAYMWLMMWNNPRWQAHWLRRAVQSLSLDDALVRAVMLMRCLLQAQVFFEQPSLSRVQVQLTRRVLAARSIDALASKPSFFQSMWRPR